MCDLSSVELSAVAAWWQVVVKLTLARGRQSQTVPAVYDIVDIYSVSSHPIILDE
jgi:hypothetical protein